MEQDFTQQTLLLFAYNELDPATTAKVESRLIHDQDFQLRLHEIREMQSLLGSPRHSPHETSIQIILEESRKSQLEMH